MERELRIESDGKDFAGHTKNFFDGGTQILQQPVLHIPDRQQLQQFHRVPSPRDFIGLLISLTGAASPAVLLQLVIQSDAVDVENVGGVALVASAFLDHAQNVGALHILKSL